MAQISITRALTEVKNLGEQINKLVASHRFLGRITIVPGLCAWLSVQETQGTRCVIRVQNESDFVVGHFRFPAV